MRASGRSSFGDTDIQRKQRKVTPGRRRWGGEPLGKRKRRRWQGSPKEEGVRACKATVPRDIKGATSEPQLLSPERPVTSAI